MNSEGRKGRSFILLGQCSFTYRIFSDLISRHGLHPSAVVISNQTADHDPFVTLTPIRESEWLVAHHFYYEGWRTAVRIECLSRGIPLIETDRPCRAIPDAEALVVAGFAAKIPEHVLKRFGPAAINIHPALLPFFRGPNPEAQFILSGETRTGVTIHTMTSEFDAGPILAQASFTPSRTSTVGDIEKMASEHATDLLADVLSRQSLSPINSDHRGSGTYYRAYESNTLLNLRSCASNVQAFQRMRLRPEGYAFWEERDKVIYPLSLDSTNCGLGPKCQTSCMSLTALHWIQVSDGRAVEYESERI